jgi:hypothetical protein
MGNLPSALERGPCRGQGEETWRRVDSNYRHTGYEPGALPLSYTATLGPGIIAGDRHAGPTAIALN